ncbi:MAG: phytoene desaturase family protein, partial [Chitinophagaceae bacterium]
MKKSIVIGSGFAGLSAASFLAKEGHQVTVLEKLSTPGGRARQWKEQGFTFDMGPSWYWMPDIFDRYFSCFGKTTSAYYSLKRLDPSYRVYWDDSFTDIPADYEAFRRLLEQWEPGSAQQLDRFLKEAAYKYRVGIQNLVFKPGLSWTEFIDWSVFKGALRLDVFTSIKKHIHHHFKHPKIRQLLEFPVLFLGALPDNTPALYSLMNYADIVGGTWYPEGGMYGVVQGMYDLARELGVRFHFNEAVTHFDFTGNEIHRVHTPKGSYEADVIVGGADYAFIENQLLPQQLQSYTPAYWDKREMAPSCLLYYIGLNKRLKGISHHMLFFDVPFAPHAQEIYTTRR